MWDRHVHPSPLLPPVQLMGLAANQLKPDAECRRRGPRVARVGAASVGAMAGRGRAWRAAFSGSAGVHPDACMVSAARCISPSAAGASTARCQQVAHSALGRLEGVHPVAPWPTGCEAPQWPERPDSRCGFIQSVLHLRSFGKGLFLNLTVPVLATPPTVCHSRCGAAHLSPAAAAMGRSVFRRTAQ